MNCLILQKDTSDATYKGWNFMVIQDYTESHELEHKEMQENGYSALFS